jgi:drug/metabolite transporter (DMT)-like permease
MIKRTCSSSVPTFAGDREKEDRGIGRSLGDGRILFALTAGACLFALVIVLKNILHVPESRLLPDIVVYIGVYTGFSLVYPVAIHERHSRKINNPVLWSALIVVMTLAIIVLYAL